MKQKIRWGILSTSKIAVTKVIPAIQNSPYSLVTAIASRDPQKARTVAEKLHIDKYYGSYDELLKDPEIDAIYNPLPNSMHVPWTIKAMEAGKHVLCEKPIGINANEVGLLETISQKYSQLKVMEAFMYRFHPQWQKAYALVKSGAIGKVKTIQSFFSYFNIDPDNIRNKTDVHGGSLMDIGCYCISFARFIYHEEPIAVTGTMDIDPQLGIDRNTSAILKFLNGKTATFTCSTQMMPFQQVNILGDSGQIRLEIPVNTRPTETTKIELISKECKEEILFDPVDQYTLQADAFCKSILYDIPVPTPLKDAVGNMKVIDSIIRSSLENQMINI